MNISEPGGLKRSVSGKLRVFLCHASRDKPAVIQLYDWLEGNGFDAWLDEKNLLPGQDWQLEISKAVRSSDVVLVCLSSYSVTKRGYVQNEIRIALDVADEQPEGTIFMIPTRLEPCEVPERLRRWHWVNLFEKNGFNNLLRTLQARTAEVYNSSVSEPSLVSYLSPPDAVGAVYLTRRERDVLVLLARGLSNKEIGYELSIAPSTVKSHAQRIYEKMNVHGRWDAAVLARELGII